MTTLNTKAVGLTTVFYLLVSVFVMFQNRTIIYKYSIHSYFILKASNKKKLNKKVIDK